MTKLTLPIEIGKKYVRRDGQVVTARYHGGGYDGRKAIWPGDEDRSAVWQDNGRVWDCSPDDMDLVSDYQEPAKGHPHAEKMAEFAQDARETDRPWERWEASNDDGKNWYPMSHMDGFIADWAYRRKATITPDPHAASMLLYAQDAAETDKAWMRWEFRSYIRLEDEWRTCAGHPTWSEYREYRRKAQS